jgi:type IV secretion system protein VirD4
MVKEMTDNTFKSIMAGLRKNLHVYSDELVARMTCTSDFAPSDLRTGKEPCTVYLTVPFGQDDLLNVNRVLMRQWLGAAMQQSETPSTTRQTMHGWDFDLLALLDEVQSLKRLDLLPDTVNYGAGFGVRLVMITPSLKSLDELYGAHNFLESTAVQAYFGITESRIAEHISRRLGLETVTQERVTRGRGGRSVTRETARKPLIDQSGVIHLADDQVIVTTREGKLQMVVQQMPWYRYDPWKSRGDSLQ